MTKQRSIANTAFVLALICSALALFVYLHSGASGDRVCSGVGSGGPGTLSIWPPGTQCLVGDEAGQLHTYFSDLFPFALAGAWSVLTAVLVLPRRGR